MAVQPKIARLESQLAVTGLQKKDNALFQVINGIIKALQQSQIATAGEIASGGGGSVAPVLSADLLTHSDESGLLPNSRRLLAGINITFDDTVANERTISASGIGADWDVLTNGDPINPEVVFDSNGDIVMVETP